jgi:DNA-binding MarR family transcriptional regulator
MVTRAVTQLDDDVVRPTGLRATQFSILATITRLGEANLRQLENVLAIDQTTLTRVPHPDGRIQLIKLTSKR